MRRFHAQSDGSFMSGTRCRNIGSDKTRRDFRLCSEEPNHAPDFPRQKSGRRRVAGGQDYEVRYEAKKELIERLAGKRSAARLPTHARANALKIAFNINNVRKRLPKLLDWLGSAKPDIVCLQELKTTQREFPVRVYSTKAGLTQFARSTPIGRCTRSAVTLGARCRIAARSPAGQSIAVQQTKRPGVDGRYEAK